MEKWSVARNYVCDEDLYRVYRKKNSDEPLHSGNVEYASEYLKDKSEAQRIADNLNKENK